MDQEVSRRPLAVLDTEDRQRQLSLSIHSQNKTAPISPVLSPSHPGKSETPTTKRVRHDLRSSDPSYSHASSGAFSPIPLYNSPNNRLNPFGGSPQGRPPPSGGPAPRHGRTSKKPSPPRHAPGPRSGSAPGVMRQLFPIECSQQLLPRQAVPLQKTTRGHSHAPTKPSPADALKTESSMAAMRAAYRSNQQHASPIQHASKTPPAKSISPSRRGPVAQVSAPHPAQDSQARRPHPLHPVTTGNALPAKATDTSVRPVTCATSACKTTVSATTRELISSGVSPASKASAPQPQNPDAPLPTAVETRATTAPRDISSSRPLRGFTTEERTTIDVDIMPREDDRETKATVSSPVVVWTTRQFQYNLAHAILSRKAERIAALLHLYARLRVRDGMEAAGDRATPFLPCVVLVEEAGSSSTTAAQSACILDGVIDSHTGYTLMHLAVLTGSMTVVRECLRAGSAVHAVEDVQGDTPLTLAMRAFPGSVTALFAAGKGIEVSRRLEGRERSVYASLARDESMHHVPASVKELQTGCQQNLLHCAVTADGATPAWPGRIPFLKLLVEHYHVNPRQEDAFGMTPALWALEHARFLGPNAREVVQYLRDAAKRADVNDMESTKKWLRTLVSGKEAPPAEPPARIPPPADAKEVNVQRLSGAASPPLRIDRVSPPPAETGATRSYSRGRSPSVRFRTPSPSPPPAAPTGRCRTHTASPSAEGVVVHGNSKEVGKVGSRRVMLARTLSRSPGRCAMVPSPSISPSVVAMPETSPPQMVLITRHCDWLLYYLRGPITRLVCVALLLLLHIVSYSLDCSASWFREVRHGYWFTVINLLGSKWNGSTFFMGFFRVLCILLGSVGGAVVLVVLVGPFGARWLRLPCLGAFLPGEIPFLQSQFGFAYLTHYVPHRRASLWLGVVGAVSGLYFSALLYNALLHAFWSGQADWATIGPSMGSSTTYAGVMLRVWASALLIDWFLACYLLDLMYQQGVLTAYLPHYRYDTLANWIDLHLAPWLSRRVLWRVCTHARFRQKMSSVPPVYVPLTRTDGDAPEKDDDAPRSWISKRLGGVEMTTDLSIHRFRLWVFWVTVLTGMGILVFIFGMASLLSTPSEEVPSMVYLAEPRSPPAARACCAVLFSSLCIALLCIMVLQEWTWPALSTHRFLALPGTTLPFSTGWGLMLLLWIEVTYDYRQLIENARVAHAHGAGALTVAILFTSPVWAASIFTLAMILSTSGYLNRCGVISTTHDSGDGLARHRPWLASAVLMWRTWLAGVHLTSIPAPGVFGLLRTLQPQLPQWAQLDEDVAVVSSTSTDSAAAKSPLAAVDAEEVAVSELLAVLDHHGMLPMVLKASGVVSASANLPCSDSDSLSDNGSIADNAKAPDSTDVDADNMAKLRHVAAHRWRYARRKRLEWRAEVLAGAAGTSRGRRKRYVARRKEKSLVHVILGGSE